MAKKEAWGLDVAGFSTGKSILALAVRGEGKKISVTIYRDNPFNKIRGGDRQLTGAIEKEKKFISECVSRERQLYIDTPIDLQKLPDIDNPNYIWQLTKRPVDKAFNALPPLADRIGSAVARINYLRKLSNQSNNADILNSRIFETYPAASLQCMHLPHTGYKGKPAYWSSSWDGGLNGLPERLSLRSQDNEITLTDDDFDAILCALCGVVDAKNLLKGEKLNSFVKNHKKLQPFNNEYFAPEGYVLLKRKNEYDWLYTINIKIEDELKLDSDC